MLRFRLLWVLPDFGLYFLVKRPQDPPIDATVRIFGHYGIVNPCRLNLEFPGIKDFVPVVGPTFS